MYRKRISELYNGAATALLLGESKNETLNNNIERGRIISGKIGIVDDSRTDKEVKCKDEDVKDKVIRLSSRSIHIHID